MKTNFVFFFHIQSHDSTNVMDGTGNQHKHSMLQFIKALGYHFNSAQVSH